MSWAISLKVWIKNNKYYIQCTCCHGGGKIYLTHDPEGGYPSNQLPKDEYEVTSTSDGGVVNYTVKCGACDGKGYQVANVEFFDYDTQVSVNSEGQFKLVP
jgi:hypothetical protein